MNSVITYFMFRQANLRLDRRMKKSEKVKLVQEILTGLGLTACIDTRIGHTHKGKALSGGEKKRLSFASELLTKPPLLFCDEPTTGLGRCGLLNQWWKSIFIFCTGFARRLQCTATRTNSANVGKARHHDSLHDSSAIESSVCHVSSGAVFVRRKDCIYGPTRRSRWFLCRVCHRLLKYATFINIFKSKLSPSATGFNVHWRSIQPILSSEHWPARDAWAIHIVWRIEFAMHTQSAKYPKWDDYSRYRKNLWIM